MYIAAVFIAERARGNEKCDPTIDMTIYTSFIILAAANWFTYYY